MPQGNPGGKGFGVPRHQGPTQSWEREQNRIFCHHPAPSLWKQTLSSGPVGLFSWARIRHLPPPRCALASPGQSGRPLSGSAAFPSGKPLHAPREADKISVTFTNTLQELGAGDKGRCLGTLLLQGRAAPGLLAGCGREEAGSRLRRVGGPAAQPPHGGAAQRPPEAPSGRAHCRRGDCGRTPGRGPL